MNGTERSQLLSDNAFVWEPGYKLEPCVVLTFKQWRDNDAHLHLTIPQLKGLRDLANKLLEPYEKQEDAL